MKATVVGYRPYSMTDEKTGAINAGISLFLVSQNQSDSEIRGMTAGKYTMKSTCPDYTKLMNYQFIKPFEANVDMYVSPSGKSSVEGMTFGIEK